MPPPPGNYGVGVPNEPPRRNVASESVVLLYNPYTSVSREISREKTYGPLSRAAGCSGVILGM